MATGTVAYFDPAKGFGLIRPDTGGENIYVLHDTVKATGLSRLDDDQKVSYEVETRNGKQTAINLTLI